MIIDSHAHLYWKNTQNKIPEILDKMDRNNIEFSVQIWCDLETSNSAINLAKEHKIFFATVWYHPSDCQDDNNPEEIIKKLENKLLENKDLIVWIWETWFDYYHSSKDKDIFETQKENQSKSFILQLELAKKYDLPIIIHSRNAKEDTLNFLKKYKPNKLIFHCFSEDLEFAQELLKYCPNTKFSFSGIVTYKTAISIQETAANIPLNNILVETDSPFLAPDSIRWKTNDSSHVKEILEKVISLRLSNKKNINLKETSKIIEDQIYKNTKEIYNI